MTSAASDITSRPSTLPTKFDVAMLGGLDEQRVRLLAERVALAGLLADRQQTDLRRRRARSGDGRRSNPSGANCTSSSGWTSAFAPASSSTVGGPSGTGMIVAIAGRLTPLIRPMRNSADAIVAPVLPAEIMADASPSRTASAARTRVESFLRRTALPPSSSISMTSDASISGRSPMSTRSPRSGGPTRTTGVPDAAAARAPATIASGA